MQKDSELGRCRTAVQNQLANALDVALGDVADVLGPVFPIHLVAALLHDYGVHGLLQLSIGEIYLHLTGIAGRALLAVFARVSVRTRAAILTFALILIDVDDLNNGSGCHVVLQRVDAALESLIMASQGLDYLPHDFKGIGVVQSLFGRVAGGDDHRQDDVSVVFAFEAAHDAPNCLDDLHAGLLGLQKHDGIQVRHVHAFGKAADVGEDVAPFLAGVCEPGKLVLAVRHVHGAVDVLYCAFHAGNVVALFALVVYVGLDRSLEVFGDAPGLRDGRTKSDRILQRMTAAVLLALVRQAFPAPDNLCGIGDLETLLVGHGALVHLAHHIFRDGERDDTIIREQPFVHGAPEREAVEHRSEFLLIVHRRDLVALHLRLHARLVAVNLRRGRHVDALLRRDQTVVVHLGERALVGKVVRGGGCSGGAMGLVADDEVERIESHALGIGNHLDGLVGREHDVHALRAVEALYLLVQCRWVCGGGIRDIGKG